LRIVRDKAGEKGRQVKEENENRLMALFMELKVAHDGWKSSGGSDLKEFGLKHAPSIALKYPDVLMRQGKNLKKLLEKQGLNGLEL